MKETPVALITGSAKRVGACIATSLHENGMRVAIHYHQSQAAAQVLCTRLNAKRPNSAIMIQGDLTSEEHIIQLVKKTLQTWQRLDVLVNNAACFNPTALATLQNHEWHNMIQSNLTAPFLLSLQAAPYLKESRGCIINLVDIRASQPLKNYTPYCISKAGLVMATKSLALEWAPDIRVNGIAPGVVLWPDEIHEKEAKHQQKIIARTPLKQAGTPEDIAKAVRFLVQDAPYITGQIITVDGGRSLAY